VLPDPPTRGPARRPVAISSTWVLHRHECRLPRTGVAAPMARRLTHASPVQDRTVRLRFDRCAPRGGAIAHVLRVGGAGRARPAGPSGPTGRRASDARWRRLPPLPSAQRGQPRVAEAARSWKSNPRGIREKGGLGREEPASLRPGQHSGERGRSDEDRTRRIRSRSTRAERSVRALVVLSLTDPVQAREESSSLSGMPCRLAGKASPASGELVRNWEICSSA